MANQAAIALMAARLSENFRTTVSEVTAAEYLRAFGGPYVPDSVIVTITDKVIDERAKMPTLADLKSLVTEEQSRLNRDDHRRQQLAYVEPTVTRPNIAEKALYRYIYLSAGSRTPVSVAGFEEYALRVFKLDPDSLINSHGSPIQGTLFGEPMPQGERWPQVGPPLPEKLYLDPWTGGNSSATGIGKSFPTAGRAMSPREIFAERKRAVREGKQVNGVFIDGYRMEEA